MVLIPRPGEAAPQADRLLLLLNRTWDFTQRVEIIGIEGLNTATLTVRSKASETTMFVQLHVQTTASGEGGASYDTVNFKSSARVDCRLNHQQDHSVSRERDETTYVWIIPVFLEGDQTTYTKYDGVDGTDQMAFLEIGPDSGFSAIETVAVDTILTVDHDTILVDASGAARTITLPAAATLVGKQYEIKKIDVSANAVTIDGDGSETIDDTTTRVLASQYDAVRIRSDGSEWWIL